MTLISKYSKIFFTICLLPLALSSNAQESRQQSVGLGFSAMRMDFFLQGNYQIQFNKLEFSAGAGIGIIRSIFQTRLFPQATLRTSYYWLNRPAVQLGPTISLNCSVNQQNNQNAKYNYWQQYYVGYCFTAGKRLKFVQITEIGPQFESFYSDYDQRYVTGGILGYSLHLGLRYVL